jgi:uncharacterized protein DUF4258
VPDETKLRFVYFGPEPDERKAIVSSPKMLSSENLHLIVVRAWVIGRYQITNHFRKRGLERGFDVLDAENAIQFGKLRGAPEHCPEYSNWKCRIIGPVEGKQLEIVIALDDFEDYHASPLIIPITGYWR